MPPSVPPDGGESGVLAPYGSSVNEIDKFAVNQRERPSQFHNVLKLPHTVCGSEVIY